MLTVERLRSLLRYNPRTGVFVWVARSSPSSLNIVIGAQAGAPTKDGNYGRIMVDGIRYYTHVLAWLYMTGEMPSDEVDHRDRTRSNNRWLNLRAATRKQNTENRDVEGVDWMPRIGKWRARILHNGRSHYLGVFKSIKSARAARRKAVREFFTHAP